MNNSDNKDTFSNNPNNEDWIENDKTNSLSGVSKEETSEFVEETSMPFVEKEEGMQNQEEIEEIMNIETVEEIHEGILEEEFDHEMIEAEITQIDELEEGEINADLIKAEIYFEELENIEEEESSFEEDFIKEEVLEQEEEEIVEEFDYENEEDDFIDFNEEKINETQNDMVASIENTEINEVNFITEEKIDLNRGFTDINDIEGNDVFIEEFSTFINEEVNEEDMFRKPNLFFAILGGLGAILASSLFWAESASLLDKYYNYDHKYAYMALLVGICVGLGMRWAGKGKTYGFGILAVILTLCGSLSGTLLSTLVHVVEAFGVSYFDIFEIFDFTFLYGLLEDRFQNLDVAFYLSACILAYWIVVRKQKK